MAWLQPEYANSRPLTLPYPSKYVSLSLGDAIGAYVWNVNQEIIFRNFPIFRNIQFYILHSATNNMSGRSKGRGGGKKGGRGGGGAAAKMGNRQVAAAAKAAIKSTASGTKLSDR